MFDNDIDDSDPNRHHRLQELCGNVYRVFDISRPKWNDHPLSDINIAKKNMEVEWLYIGEQFLDKKFHNHCRSILKKPGQNNVDPKKWAISVSHFTSLNKWAILVSHFTSLTLIFLSK